LPIVNFLAQNMSTTTTTTPKKERERKSQSSADGTSSTLVFRNLPSTTTSADFSTFVSSLAPIQHAFVVTKKTDSGIQCEGYGFVTFTEKPDAINLVNNPPKYNSHTVTVAYAKPRQRRQQEEPKPKRVQLSKDPSMTSGFFLTPFFGRGNGQGLPGLRVLPAARRARSGKLIT
jgi:RNA recognition motif-containing protein